MLQLFATCTCTSSTVNYVVEVASGNLSHVKNKGISHIGSICSSPDLIMLSPNSLLFENKAGNSVPNATGSSS